MIQSPKQSAEFHHILKRLQRGDEKAVTALMELYASNFHRMAHKLIGPQLRRHLDSDDLVQSVKISLLVGMHKGKYTVDTPEGFLALARVLLRRQVARLWRRLKPIPGGTQEIRVDSTMMEGPLLAVSSEPDPSHALESKDTMAHFLQQLEPIDRRLVELRSLGFSTADVARILNVDAGLLRVRLLRLRERYAHLFPRKSQQ